MKHQRVLLMLLFFFPGFISYSNIAPSISSIDSLVISENSWSFKFKHNGYSHSIDTVLIISNTDTSSITNEAYDFLKEHGYLVVTPESLNTPIEIKQEGGRIRVADKNTYKGWPFDEPKLSIRYGNDSSACIRSPKEGEFISALEGWGSCDYTVCNSKSCNIILTGKLYGIDGSLLKNHRFNYYWEGAEYGAVIASDSDGHFTKKLTVTVKHELSFFSGANRGGGYFFEPIEISDHPGDTVFADIKLTSITVSEKEVIPAEPQALFFAYPNPADGFVNFSYKLNGTAQEAVMSIFCANGKLIKQLPITSPEGKIELLLGREFPAGTYPYTVSSQGKVIYKGRFAVK
jgi:hypothetical protein